MLFYCLQGERLNDPRPPCVIARVGFRITRSGCEPNTPRRSQALAGLAIGPLSGRGASRTTGGEHLDDPTSLRVTHRQARRALTAGHHGRTRKRNSHWLAAIGLAPSNPSNGSPTRRPQPAARDRPGRSRTSLSVPVTSASHQSHVRSPAERDGRYPAARGR